MRQRLARREEQRQQRSDEAAGRAALPRILGRLEDCAATVQQGVEAPEWAYKRERIRTLVKRVAVAQNEVNIVFRVDPYPGEADPEKKSLQLCRGREYPALWRAGFGLLESVLIDG